MTTADVKLFLADPSISALSGVLDNSHYFTQKLFDFMVQREISLY
jgi:hypothetical protein